MPEGQKPTIGFVGIHAAGRAGQVPGQDELLAQWFASEGYPVRLTSSVRWPPTRTLDQIRALLMWRDVDVVVVATYSHASFAIAEFGSLLGRLWGRKVVLFLHGGNLPVFAPAHRGRVRRAFDRAHLIAAPSGYLASAFASWGYEVEVIPNVLPPSTQIGAARTKARPAILWMRTFYEDYDPVGAVEAFALVAAQRPDATLTMAGADQGLLEPCRRRATELGVADRIRFPGFIDPVAKAKAFADHDIFLNTNVVDNTPVSVIEASAAGLVPVATEVGGIPALLTDDVDSLLVPARSPQAAADAVLALLADPDRYQRLSAGALERAEASTWPAVHRRWREVLASLGLGPGR